MLTPHLEKHVLTDIQNNLAIMPNNQISLNEIKIVININIIIHIYIYILIHNYHIVVGEKQLTKTKKWAISIDKE